MSQKKMKKEFVILGGIIILLILYLIVKQTDRVHYQVPRIPAVKKADISRIEIIGPKETVQLAYTNNQWVIAPKNYPIDAEKISSILQNIEGLTISMLISKSKNYREYGLDKDNRIILRVYKQNQKIRELEIGKQAPTYQHTFVKLQGDDNVYYANDSIRSNFEQSVNDLRNKQVLKFDTNEISEITIQLKDKKLQFAKNVPPDQMKPDLKNNPTQPGQKDDISWVSPDGKKGKKSTLDSIIQEMSGLTCDKYVEDKKQTDFPGPDYVLTLKGNKEYQLTLYKTKEKENDKDVDKIYGVSSDNPFLFALPTYRNDTFLKEEKDLWEEAPAAPEVKPETKVPEIKTDVKPKNTPQPKAPAPVPVKKTGAKKDGKN